MYIPRRSEVKECVELLPSLPQKTSWCGAQLKKKHRDNFTFIWRYTARKKSNFSEPDTGRLKTDVTSYSLITLSSYFSSMRKVNFDVGRPIIQNSQNQNIIVTYIHVSHQKKCI
jgi:ribosomal protein S25